MFYSLSLREREMAEKTVKKERQENTVSTNVKCTSSSHAALRSKLQSVSEEEKM